MFTKIFWNVGLVLVGVLVLLALGGQVLKGLQPAPPPATSVGAPVAMQPQSAITLPSEVVIEQPKKLQRGALLKIFPYLQNTPPDPMLGSPLKVSRVPGLALTRTDGRYYQETSGYFQVKQAGLYNFAVVDSKNNFPPPVAVRIDGQALATSRGGTVQLEPGWHHLGMALFTTIDGSGIGLLWGAQAQQLRPIQIFREAS